MKPIRPSTPVHVSFGQLHKTEAHMSQARNTLPVQARLDPTLRANPYPEVTDLTCRLPLPTLIYRPEASHLGDLLRIRYGLTRLLNTPHAIHIIVCISLCGCCPSTQLSSNMLMIGQKPIIVTTTTEVLRT